MDSTTLALALALVGLLVGLALGVVVGVRLSDRSRLDLRAELRSLSAQAVAESSHQVMALADSRVRATEQVVAPVRDSLDRLNERLGSLERSGSSWQAQLKQQVESVHLSGEELRRETRALSEALRRPQVRGSWGEMQLKRSLELSGLTEHCTYEQQVSRTTDDGVLRPDVVISLAGGKHVVVDAKVPLDAFLTASQADDPGHRDHALAHHARQVRQHVDQLAAKGYWRQFTPAPEFVVMFMPGEAIFAQALDVDPRLLDYAAAKKVMLATPTTLIAMLKTVAYAWTQETVADNAREVQDLGRELYERLSTVAGHLDALGRTLGASVGSYNRAVGSLESRVLVSARRMRDLGVTDGPLDPPRSLTESTRPLAAPEMVASEHDDDVVVDGAPGRERWIGRAAGA
jgi:DNA recombination protein RmuC